MHVLRLLRRSNCRFLLSILLFAACTAQATPVSPTPSPPNSAGVATSSAADIPLAIFTFVDGDVVIEPADVGAAMDAIPFSPIWADSRIRAVDNGRATIVCSNNRAIQLLAPAEVVVTESSCDGGGALPSDSIALVTPTHGQMRVNQGSFDLEEDARERESDYGNIPIILRPRNSTLIDLEPPITWVEVAGAIEYQLALSGPSSFEDITVKAEAISCEPDPRTEPNRNCTISWPTPQWALQPGKRYFLTISARLNLAEPLRDSERSRVRTATAEERAQLQGEIADLQALGLDMVTSELLSARLYVEKGSYDEAITRYEHVLELQPTAVIYNTLSDLFRAVDLQRFAFLGYEQALTLSQQEGGGPQMQAGIEAAAAFGMGQVEYNRMNFGEAEGHFARAVELYRQLGADEELQAAQEAFEKARNRQ